MSEPEYLDADAVAERTGLTRETIIEYLRRGDIPEPDHVWLKHPLWLVDTIDEWRSQRYMRRNKRPMLRRRTVNTPTGMPKIAQRASTTVPRGRKDKRTSRVSSSVGASKIPSESTITEDVARNIAAQLRAEGHYCTTADVMTLADVEDEETLEHERRKLRQRIRQKLRR